MQKECAAGTGKPLRVRLHKKAADSIVYGYHNVSASLTLIVE